MAAKAWYKPSALPQLIARFDPPPPPAAARATAAPDYANRKAIEVWTTTCIVTNFGKIQQRDNGAIITAEDYFPSCNVLVNPANPNLSGPNSFPYFPRGGPQPLLQPNRHAHHIMGYVSQWGGMDVGSGMLFSAEAIDGLVHQLGGLRLRAECSLVPTHKYAYAYANQQTNPESKESNNNKNNGIEGDSAKCPVGTAVMTSPGGAELQKHYDTIIHTTPPFYNYPPSMTNDLREVLGIKPNTDASDDLHSWSRELLGSCYRQSFNLAFGNSGNEEDEKYSLLRNTFGLFGANNFLTGQKNAKRVAVPLLGSGCRAFPKDIAMDVATSESASWLCNNIDSLKKKNSMDSEETIVFGLLEEKDAELLSSKLVKMISELQ